MNKLMNVFAIGATFLAILEVAILYILVSDETVRSSIMFPLGMIIGSLWMGILLSKK